MSQTAEIGPGRQFAAMIAILLATAAALVFAAGGRDEAPAATDASAPTLDPEELIRLSVEATPAVSRRIERIRGLSFDAVPEPETITGAGLTRIERRELERTGDTDGLGADEATVRILGLLEPSEQLEDAVASSGDLAAAAYDPRTDRLYVVSDAVSADAALVEFLLAHELTHALEDQRFGLADLSAASNDDSALALLALTEGTATALMVDYAGLHMNPFELGAATTGLDPSTGDVPAFVVEQLEWAYLAGMEFINELREVAGGWKLVDYALGSRPPASSEQILHPEKYIREELPQPVRIDGTELERAGWQAVDRGVAGEYSTRQLLELGGDESSARTAAAGWGGDRYELWRRDGAPGGCAGTCREELVLVLRWQMDTPADADKLAVALAGYAEQGLGGTPAGQVTWTVEGGTVATATSGSEVALVFAPAAELAGAVAAAQVADEAGPGGG